MNSIFKYIRDFYNKEFHWLYFGLVICMLGAVIYLNYWHGLEKKYAAGGKTKFSNFLGYYFLYLIPFATAFLLQLFFFKDCTYFKNTWFWIILLSAPAIFSFRVNFNFHQSWINQQWQPPYRSFYLHCINWVVRVFVVLIPVVIIWWLKDSNNQPFYGSRALQNVQPYFTMLLIMIPFIALASVQKDFLHVYPKAKLLSHIPINHFTDRWRYLVFELCYGFDFVSIEFFFRGFLILSLLNICGTHCIIPVACFYCTIHLGKPMAEAISSFFGGVLLGIVACNTGSVWGGLIAHLGIAWMMEIGGWTGSIFQKTINGK